MALWTPYADEAMDLTKPIKKEVLSYDEYQYLPPQGYPYQSYPVYSGQISPVSGISVSSFESYYQSSFRPAPMSPPISPANDDNIAFPPSYDQRPYIEAVSMNDQRRPVTSSYDQRIPFNNSALTSHRPSSPSREQRTFSGPLPVQEHKVLISDASTYRKRSFDSIDVDTLSDDPDFQAFERDALRAMAEKNGGALLGNNPRMRRAVRSNNETPDDSYRKQRERNNFAAKQSRDRRKLREIHLALKVTYLKKEVTGLKALLAGKVCSKCQQPCRC